LVDRADIVGVLILQTGDTAMFGQHRGPMRLLIMIAVAVVVIAIGYTVKTTLFPSAAANLLTSATPAATTMSPHEIHLNYKAMKELPVHDSTNAN
jgi:flagellar basal body-associated protein FliL